MMLRSEKIFRRDDGSRVKIIVRAGEYRMSAFTYQVEVLTCGKGKRSWYNVVNTNDYSYRGLSMDDRAKYEKETQLKHVTEYEILQAKLELWETLKPKQESENETK